MLSLPKRLRRWWVGILGLRDQEDPIPPVVDGAIMDSRQEQLEVAGLSVELAGKFFGRSHEEFWLPWMYQSQ
jgi:hypothetical protein